MRIDVPNIIAWVKASFIPVATFVAVVLANRPQRITRGRQAGDRPRSGQPLAADAARLREIQNMWLDGEATIIMF